MTDPRQPEKIPGADESPIDGVPIHRPSFGIRTRLTLSFFSLVLLALAMAVAAWVMLSRMEVRLRFLENADRYTMEIQQARRFEKNYFLYGTNLRDVQEHLVNARVLLESSDPEASRVLTSRQILQMQVHLKKYGDLIQRLVKLENGPAMILEVERGPIEAEIRDHGSYMVSFALELAQEERRRVDETIALFKLLPWLLLGILLIHSLILARFLGRQMLEPLTRLMATTQHIANGDYTPLKAARWYRDEFSNLRVALNTMMREVAHRQDVLVQSHKLRAIGTLTAGIAHELNNPINNITLTAEMLKEDYHTLSEEECLEMVDDLVEQAGRSQKIVRNLLDFAREGEITTEKLDLGDLLRGTAALAANQIKLSGAKIRLEIPDNLPPIHGDKQSLSQAFLNLLLNALDAVGKGGNVLIQADPDRTKGSVRVRVIDDGHGIPDHILPNIFDPFFTTKSRGKGTGLGLGVSLGILRQHGGGIHVESIPEKGTTFTVLLPAAMVPQGS